MNQIILASHSKLAAGMNETIKFFTGNQVEVLEQTMQDNNFENQVSEMLKKHEDKNCVVFTDLYGGSVNQIFSRKLKEHSFHLVTGMNLPVILECMFAQEDIDETFIRQAVNSAKEQFCYMNDVLQALTEDDEED